MKKHRQRSFVQSRFLKLLLPFIMCNTGYAQIDVANLLSLSNGPGAALFSPVSELGLLPRSVENGGVLFQAGEDIVLSEQGPVATVLGLGGPLKGQLIPVLDVVAENPLGLGDYFMSGGTVISRELALPPIPIVNAPLSGL